MPMIRMRRSVYGVEPGKIYGTREVLGAAFSRGIGNRWFVVMSCTCGNIGVVACSDLVHSGGESGTCKSCSTAKKNHTHGEAGSPLYLIWSAMKSRCTNENVEHYQYYGGRGIGFCGEWDSYEVFRDWALAHGYGPGKIIDRKDNDGDYSPDNCHFVSRKESMRNRRSNAIVTSFGESKCLVEWSEDTRCKVSYDTLQQRITGYGWEPERAIATPRRATGRWA